jgi:branched-chain amino acid aminotransferase
MIVCLNGHYVTDEAAAISIHDRGFLAGDGVFETALLHDGGFFRLPAHLDRFAASARALRLTAPSATELDAMVRNVARRNELRTANVRITLTRGTAHPTLLVTATAPAAGLRERARRGWQVVTARTRRPSTASTPPQLKALGRTYAVLARIEASEAAADDALLLTDEGHICEGPAWNVFWRTGGTLFTPSLEVGALAGVTRSVLLELAPRAGFEFHEGSWPRDVLDGADEIFATMTSVGIVSIRALDGHTLPAATPAADALQPAYWQQVAAEAAADPL